MQFARLKDVSLHYQTIGSPESKPLLVFANSLGTDQRIWRDVIMRLAGDYSILTYDMRGHGLSDTGRTPYTMPMLAADLEGLIDLIGGHDAIIVGVSVGGLVAQQLYARRPDLVRALILCDTAAKIGTDESWNARIAAIEAGGMASIADGVLDRWFTPAFRQTAEFPGYRNMLARQPADGYIATCAAIRDCDLSAEARRIAVPTICIAGDSDASTPPGLVTEFARTIPAARLEIIKDCGHLPSIEQPVALVEIMRAFIALVGTETFSHVSH